MFNGKVNKLGATVENNKWYGLTGLEKPTTGAEALSKDTLKELAFTYNVHAAPMKRVAPGAYFAGGVMLVTGQFAIANNFADLIGC
jgi:hypothetical protein